MSSFTINKSDYARVAGTIAALGVQKDYYGEQLAYKYNPEENRLYTREDIKKEIMELYNLNLDSVNKQYDDDGKADIDNYEDEFTMYYSTTCMTYSNRDRDEKKKRNMKTLIYAIFDFFRSVNYQIEDEEDSRKANEIMSFYINSVLMAVLKDLDDMPDNANQGWGQFRVYEDGDLFIK